MKPLPLVLALFLVLVPHCPAANTENQAPEEELEELQPSPETKPVQSHPGEAVYWKALKLNQKPAGNEEQIRELLEQSAKLGFSHAEIYLGVCRISGQLGYRKSKRQAARLFLQAAERGNAYAMVNVGQCFLHGEGVRVSLDKAEHWLTAALSPKADYSFPALPADFNSEQETSTATGIAGELPVSEEDRAKASAHAALGKLYSKKNQWEQALTHHIEAATAGPNGRAGDYASAVAAAVAYAFGQGVERNLVEAEKFLATSKKLLGQNARKLVYASPGDLGIDDFALGDVEDDIEEEAQNSLIKLQNAIAGSFADPKDKNYNPVEAAKWFELAAQNNSSWAMSELAFLYQEGKLGEADPVKAYEWFSKAAASGKDIFAESNKALCLAAGLGVEKDIEAAQKIWAKHETILYSCYLGLQGEPPAKPLRQEELLELTKKEAEAGKPRAQLIHGVHLMNGWGMTEDFKGGCKWIAKAAAAGDSEALRRHAGICLIDPRLMPGGQGKRLLKELFGRPQQAGPTVKEIQEAISNLKKAGARGSMQAWLDLGNLSLEGFRLPKDAKAALQYFEHVPETSSLYAQAQVGLARAQKMLATASYKNEKKREQKEQAVQALYTHLEKAKALDSGVAFYELGLLAREGKFETKDSAKAYALFEEASTRKAPDRLVHLQMGEILEEGEDLSISLQEAAYHYRLAALDGNKIALRKLCRLYSEGKGLPLDWKRSLHWHAQLANAGEREGILGVCEALLHLGETKEAYKILRSLSWSGDPILKGYASGRLSAMFAKGNGVKANADKAKSYLRTAVKLGDPDALYAQANQHLLNGKKADCLTLLQSSVAKGGVPALMQLAEIYLKGELVSQDASKAYSYYLKAAKKGNADAMDQVVRAFNEGKCTLITEQEAQRFIQLLQAYEDPRAAALAEGLDARGHKAQESAQADSSLPISS